LTCWYYSKNRDDSNNRFARISRSVNNSRYSSKRREVNNSKEPTTAGKPTTSFRKHRGTLETPLAERMSTTVETEAATAGLQ
jgi:hypothetical protein